MASNKTESVKVAVRVRPLNSKEKEVDEPIIVNVDKATHQVQVKKPNGEIKSFTFDRVLGRDTEQMEVFEDVARPIVDSVITGYNGTIFAYGQTGTGKTFTMEGVVTDEDLRGVMPNTFNHIFHEIGEGSNEVEYLVRVSFLEIYNDEVYDLLNKEARTKMQVKEGQSGVYVKDLTTLAVNSVAETMKVLKRGQKGRQTGATRMNPGSSRSHSIFCITVETCEKDEDGQPHYRVGKLNLVDLAGSERQKKTDASGERLTEAKNINLSLSALGNVINALVNPKAGHIPFRDSKLTRLLQDSLGGNTKTAMIANIGPAESNFDETMSTLRYANRAKNIQNKPTVNEDPKDAMLRAYQEEIEILKEQLSQRKQGLAGVQEEIVEKVVVKHIGVSEEKLREMEQQAAEETQMLVKMHEEEKQKILATKTEAEAAASEYQRELEAKQQQIQAEREEINKLEKLLSGKEMHLLVGGKEVEKAEAQMEKLKETEQKLREQAEKESELQRHLEEAEDANLYMNEQYSSRQEELEKKTKKLKRLWLKYREKAEDLKDIQDEYEVERSDLIDTIRELTHQLKLKTALLDLHVSPEHLALIEKHASWDSFSDEWQIAGYEYTGNNLRNATGSTTEESSDAGSAHHRRLSTYERIANMVNRGREVPGMMGGQQRAIEKQQTLEAALANLESPNSHVFFSYGSKSKTKVKAKSRRPQATRHKRLGRT